MMGGPEARMALALAKVHEMLEGIFPLVTGHRDTKWVLVAIPAPKQVAIACNSDQDTIREMLVELLEAWRADLH